MDIMIVIVIVVVVVIIVMNGARPHILSVAEHFVYELYQTKAEKKTDCMHCGDQLAIRQAGYPILCETNLWPVGPSLYVSHFLLYLAVPVPTLSIDYAPLNPIIISRQHNLGLYHLLEKKVETVGI
ncbi:hypothetical protein F5B17DRAFT_346916 [Nemania serpens]|nr:hypothetical protein F5B17DRAFT_346916 [Nemania serpens]